MFQSDDSEPTPQAWADLFLMNHALSVEKAGGTPPAWPAQAGPWARAQTPASPPPLARRGAGESVASPRSSSRSERLPREPSRPQGDERRRRRGGRGEPPLPLVAAAARLTLAGGSSVRRPFRASGRPIQGPCPDRPPPRRALRCRSRAVGMPWPWTESRAAVSQAWEFDPPAASALRLYHRVDPGGRRPPRLLCPVSRPAPAR